MWRVLTKGKGGDLSEIARRGGTMRPSRMTSPPSSTSWRAALSDAVCMQSETSAGFLFAPHFTGEGNLIVVLGDRQSIS